MVIDLLKALMWLWPFLSEVFFDNKSFKEIIKNNKLLTFLIFLLAISIFINYLALSKINRILQDQKQEIVIEKEKIDYEYLQKQLYEIYKQ